MKNSLKIENKAFRETLKQIAACPRTYPEMCCVCNKARMVLEEYPIPIKRPLLSRIYYYFKNL